MVNPRFSPPGNDLADTPRSIAVWEDALPLGRLLGQCALLSADFYSRDTIAVARELLGKVLLHGQTAVRIVEVEAYLGLDDLAAHAAKGVTPRTKVVFGPPGHAYVYFIYGMHECLNIVAEPAGVPGCVLIRAGEPLCGVGLMRERRRAARTRRDLASGPGRLTQAMGISRAQNGHSLVTSKLQILSWSQSPGFETGTSPRIGIRLCQDWPLRFFISGSPFLSR